MRRTKAEASSPPADANRGAVDRLARAPSGDAGIAPVEAASVPVRGGEPPPSAVVLRVVVRGGVADGFAPFVCGPYPEFGADQIRDAPTLVRDASSGEFALAIAVRGFTPPVERARWRVGLRALDPAIFKTGAAFGDAADLDWSVEVVSDGRHDHATLVYYSGWPRPTARVEDGRQRVDLPLAPDGEGRRPGESRWRTAIPVARLDSAWGMTLIGPDGATDRPPGGGLYQPRGRTVVLVDGEVFAGPPPARRSPPRTETISVAAPALDHDFRVHVFLPRDFDADPDRRYPLVYLNDGQNQRAGIGAFGGWHTDWIAAQAMRGGRLRDCVFAAVEMHPERNRAYFPAATASTPHGQADDYTDFLAGPLRDRLRAEFRADDGPVAIVGSSNGAIHALSAALRRPDLFRAVGCLSYAVLAPERNFAALEAAGPPAGLRIYIDSGTRWGENDPDDATTDDNVAISRRLRDLLLARGLVLEADVRYRLAYGDAHNEQAWRGRIGDCLEFLLPPP